MPTLVLDLETAVDKSMLPYKSGNPDLDFPPPPYWRIEAVGAVWLDDDGFCQRIGTIPGETELERFEALAKLLAGRRVPPRLVTFGGRNFDLPVLGAASMRLGVPLPDRWRAYAKRWDGPHLDLFEKLGDSGACRNAGGLEAWATSLGWPGKLGAHGSDVATLLAEGKRDHVDAYVIGDVVLTAAVLFRWEHSNGALDGPGYVARVQRLLEVGRADPRLAVWLEGVDEAVALATWGP
jgi:3'-5' exonuclease